MTVFLVHKYVKKRRHAREGGHPIFFLTLRKLSDLAIFIGSDSSASCTGDTKKGALALGKNEGGGLCAFLLCPLSL
jgi:hypothetical protein